MAVMLNFQNARAGAGDDGCELGEGAGAVADADRKAAKPALGGEAALDDASEDGDVNVSAAENQDDFFAGEIAGRRHGRGERNCTGAFDHGFFMFEKFEDTSRDGGLVDEEEFIEARLDEFEAEFADFSDRQAIGQGGLGVDAGDFAGLEGGVERRGVERFDTDDAHGGLYGFDGSGDAGDEASAANGDDDGFDIGDVFENFQAQRALAGDDVGVIKAGDVG